MRNFFLIILIILLSYLPAYAFRETKDLIVLYEFTETKGTVITDKGYGEPKLNLEISDPAKVTWLNPGLRVSEATVIKAINARTKLDPSVAFTNGITIEVWIKPLNNTQDGPARIVSFSKDSADRNFTFGQSADKWNQRFRTSDNYSNGSSPSTSTPAASIAAAPVLQHVVYTRDSAGNAKMYIDKVEVVIQSIPGDLTNWDLTYDFGLFNEMSFPTETRTWLGDIFLVAIYGKALTSSSIRLNYDDGLPQIPLPNLNAYGKIQGGDELHTNRVNYLIPKEIRGNYILSYELWDVDILGEIEILVNNKEIQTVAQFGNEIWSATQSVKIKDIYLCDDNLTNVITFNNTANPPGINHWGVRNVTLVKDPTHPNITLYTEPTDKEITVAWDAVVDSNYPEIHYDFFLWNQGEEQKYLTGATQQIKITFKLPRTGLYTFYGRSCNKAKTETDRICSSWNHSAMEQEDGTPSGKVKNPADPTVYIPGNWMIYGHIAAPTSGEIE
jgi:hypothetical protein